MDRFHYCINLDPIVTSSTGDVHWKQNKQNLRTYFSIYMESVPTQLNLVDCASRGLYLSEIINRPLWWTGTPFLLDLLENWAKFPDLQTEDVNILSEFETKKSTVLLVKLNSSLTDIIDRFSLLDKMLRIISYCFRFCKPRSTILHQILSLQKKGLTCWTCLYTLHNRHILKVLTDFKRN